MDSKKDQSIFDRREALKMLGIGSTAGIMGMFGSSSSARASEKEEPSYTRGMAPVKDHQC
jgi:mannonate dehydratase